MVSITFYEAFKKIPDLDDMAAHELASKIMRVEEAVAKFDVEDITTKSDIEAIQADIKDIRKEMKGMATKADIKDIREEMKGMATKADIIVLRAEIERIERNVDARLDKFEKNLLWKLIAVTASMATALAAFQAYALPLLN